MHEGGQEPVVEDLLVLHTVAHMPLPRPGREPDPVPLRPQRINLGDELGDHIGRQACDPPVADDRCTRHVPHDTTMINDCEVDISPPTMHERCY
ncbi:hypothetical protein [Streptomyces kronopolitis]